MDPIPAESMHVRPEVPEAPAAAHRLFGDRMPRASRFVEVLADTGVSHGLIGPREVARLWERHVLNCAVIEDAFPEGAAVIDVGSGAGLPGVALAIARPDLDVQLIEPMLRRTTWLETLVTDLELDNVTIHRGRAEELAGNVVAPWVTARAVARLAKLARWCTPLLAADGTLVAMKGSRAEAELDEDRHALRRLGMSRATVTEHGATLLDAPVLTVDLQFGARRATPDGSRTRVRRSLRGARGADRA